MPADRDRQEDIMREMRDNAMDNAKVVSRIEEWTKGADSKLDSLNSKIEEMSKKIDDNDKALSQRVVSVETEIKYILRPVAYLVIALIGGTTIAKAVPLIGVLMNYFGL